MLKKYTLVACCLLTLILSAVSFDTKASHAAGGELVYEWISDSTYRFYFKFYRDCSGSPEPFNVVLCANNQCLSSSTFRNMFKMTTIPGGGTNGQQVATGCANQKNKCDSAASNIPGYREWWYSADFTLPAACSSWRFSVVVPVRNSSANINGTPNFYVETILNSVDAPGNSSPDFTVKPVPYVCINQNYQYNNGGIDPNNDSVAFEVINPLTRSGGTSNCGASPTNCTFVSASPAISIPSNPFQTNNTFTVSPTSGELSFTASLQGSHTITVRANEYRNGTFIGSVMRDIQVQVITCPGTGSTKPTITNDPTSVSGAATYSGGTVFGCANKQFSFCYDIISTDTAAKLVASDNHSSAAPGSTVNYSGGLNDTIRGCMTWTPGATDTGTRVFVVSVKDSSCSSGGIPITYAITVPLYVWPSTVALKDTTICAGESVGLNAVGGSSYIWSVVPGGSGTNSLSCTNCKNPVATPSVTTSYIVTSNSSVVCNTFTDTVTVTVTPLPIASATSNSPVCNGDTLFLDGSEQTNATYSWVGPNGFTSSSSDTFIANGTSANTGFYGYTITKNGCTSQQFVLSAYVGPPNAPTLSSNSPVCEGDTLDLTAIVVSGTTVIYNWSGPNGFSTLTQNPSRNNMQLSDSGYYYCYAVIDGCQSFTDSMKVIVNELPIAPAADSDSVVYCQNVTAATLGATGTNLKWYDVSTGGTAFTNPFAPSTTTAGTFWYYVSQTNANGCEGPRDSVKVVIKPKATNPTVTTPVTYCQGATASALTATGTNLKWYTVLVGGSPLSGAPTPNTSSPGLTLFFVSQTNSEGCESDRTPISVVVNATPDTPTVTSPVQYCEAGPATPLISTFVTGQNILWYNAATGGTGSATPPSISTATPMSDTFYVSQTVNGCEGPRARIIVQVVAKPSPPTTNDVTYCQYDTATQLTAGGTNLLWYPTATGGVGDTAAPTPQSMTPGDTTYYVSQTVNGCESERDSIKVTVNPQPTQPVGNDDSICQLTTATPLTATGSNLKWYDTAVGGTALTGAPTPSTADTGWFYWYVSQTILGCESERDTVAIYIKPKPSPPMADSAEFCLNGPSSMLTATADTGATLNWYAVATGGTPLTSAPTPSTTSLGVTQWYVSQTINGCESDRDTATVVIDTTVSVFLAFSDNSFCLYDTIEVSQSGNMPDTSIFTWNWAGGTVIDGDSSGPFKIKWDTAGIKKVWLEANDQGCKASDTGTIEVLPLPTASFDMIDEVCTGKEVTTEVSMKLDNVKTFTWGFDSTNTNIISVDSNKFVAQWATSGKKVVSLFTTSDSGCISPIVYDTINVRNDPDAQIVKQGMSDKVCTKSEFIIKAKKLTGPHKYEWSPVGYFLTNKAAEVAASMYSSGYVKLQVTDEYGCTGTDSMYLSVEICCQLFMPNAFTPNNDGNNDVFRIISNGHHKVIAFRIVNRYGQVIFNANDQYDAWDGTYNGQPLPVGTYYYYIKYACQDDDANNEIEKRGDVILIR